MLPLGDAPNPRGVAWVTSLLIALNVAVYVLVTVPLSSVRPDPRDPRLAEYALTISDALDGRLSPRQVAAQATEYDLFVFTHAFRPAEPTVADLFAALFLHASFLHLFGNMLFLWIYGDNVEHALGRVQYLLAYLGTGVAATLAHAAAAAGSEVPSLGASGAISGVLGFYFVWFPRNRVRLLVLWFPFMARVIEVPARVVLGLYLVADNLLPFLLTASETGVAYGAHIGGFVAGLAAAWLIDRRGLRVPVPADVPLEPDEDAIEVALRLRARGHPTAALAQLRRLMRADPNHPDLAVAHLLAGDILLEDLRQPVPAYQHYLSALDLDPPSDVADRARAGLAAIEAMQKRRVAGR